MDSIGVKPGMVIAEIGAGRGRYVVHMAKRVGVTGKIYANDIDKKALDYLEYRCKRDSIPNVITVLGKVTDPLLPKETMDLVYMINTYHHLDKPVDLMKNIIPCLKPEGRLGIVSMSKEDSMSIMLKLYEWFHKKWPKYFDCRPIYVEQSLMDTGYVIRSKEKVRLFGLPGEIVITLKVP